MRNWVWMVVGLAACTGAETEVRDSVTLTDTYTDVNVWLDAGEVTITHGDVDAIQIDRIQRFRADPPTMTAEVVDTTLEIRTECKQCSVDHTIVLPMDAPVRVFTRAGAVELQDIDGTVEVDTDAGEIHVHGGSGLLQLNSDAGDVSVEGHAGDVVANTSAGEIQLDLPAADTVVAESNAGAVVVMLADRPVRVDAESKAGAVRVEVPSGAYAVSAATDAGDVSITGITEDPGADASLTLETSAGDVRVVGK